MLEVAPVGTAVVADALEALVRLGVADDLEPRLSETVGHAAPHHAGGTGEEHRRLDAVGVVGAQRLVLHHVRGVRVAVHHARGEKALRLELTHEALAATEELLVLVERPKAHHVAARLLRAQDHALDALVEPGLVAAVVITQKSANDARLGVQASELVAVHHVIGLLARLELLGVSRHDALDESVVHERVEQQPGVAVEELEVPQQHRCRPHPVGGEGEFPIELYNPSCHLCAPFLARRASEIRGPYGPPLS